MARIRRPPLPPITKSASKADLDRTIRNTRERADHFTLDDFSVLEVVKCLSGAIPRAKRMALQIETVQVTGDDVKLGGRANSYETVDDVEAALKDSGYFEDVRLGPLSNQRGRGHKGHKRLRFQILLKLKGVKG